MKTHSNNPGLPPPSCDYVEEDLDEVRVCNVTGEKNFFKERIGETRHYCNSIHQRFACLTSKVRVGRSRHECNGLNFMLRVGVTVSSSSASP